MEYVISKNRICDMKNSDDFLISQNSICETQIRFCDTTEYFVISKNTLWYHKFYFVISQILFCDIIK